MINVDPILAHRGPLVTMPLAKSAARVRFESELQKAGPGSRGGKVIGTTKSGKPIYDQANHPSHGGFTAADHGDAEQVHHEEWVKHEHGFTSGQYAGQMQKYEGERSPQAAAHHLKQHDAHQKMRAKLQKMKKSADSDLQKAHVKGHFRKNKSGKVSAVKQHEDKRAQSLKAAIPPRNLMLIKRGINDIVHEALQDTGTGANQWKLDEWVDHVSGRLYDMHPSDPNVTSFASKEKEELRRLVGIAAGLAYLRSRPDPLKRSVENPFDALVKSRTLGAKDKQPRKRHAYEDIPTPTDRHGTMKIRSEPGEAKLGARRDYILKDCGACQGKGKVQRQHGEDDCGVCRGRRYVKKYSDGRTSLSAAPKSVEKEHGYAKSLEDPFDPLLKSRTPGAKDKHKRHSRWDKATVRAAVKQYKSEQPPRGPTPACPSCKKVHPGKPCEAAEKSFNPFADLLEKSKRVVQIGKAGPVCKDSKCPRAGKPHRHQNIKAEKPHLVKKALSSNGNPFEGLFGGTA